MTITEIRQLLESPYNQKEWKVFLQSHFTNGKLFGDAHSIELMDKTISKKCYSLGNYEVNEYTKIGIFEVQLNDNVKLTRNRVGLRNLIKSITQQVAGAMVVFVQGDKWRFSYISKRKVKNKETDTIEDKETAPKRYTYLFGKNEKALTAAQRFEQLIHKQKENLFQSLTLNDFEEAFSVERLSKEFFDQYKKTYEDFVEYLTGKRYKKSGNRYLEQVIKEPNYQLRNLFGNDEKKARDFCKRMMGRIVFLYFIQKKGWLAVETGKKWGEGKMNYLYDLFKKSKGKENFYNTELVQLFFKTLNNPNSEDEKNALRFPYLNGGLFDETQDKKYNQLILPAYIFDNLFETFNNFNFTIYEDAPDEQTVAVDPEMLGHIFENLLEDNKDKGAFYTPKEIVHFMCQESIEAYLLAKDDLRFDNEALGKSTIHKIIHQIDLEEAEKVFAEKNAYKIIDALENVRICDPAIGSGAFPMGILQEIFNAQIYLQELKGFKKINEADIKKHIIQESIYGVDIEPGAVDIARLRFWLSLVVDETKPQALPNLDYKIMQGNSLLECFEGVDLSSLGNAKEEKDILFAQKGQYEIGAEFSKTKQSLLIFDQKSKNELYELIDDYFNYDETKDTKYKNKQFIKDEINRIVEGKLIAKYYFEKPKIERHIDEIKNNLKISRDIPTDNIGTKLKKERTRYKLTHQLNEFEILLERLNGSINQLHDLQTRTDKPYFLWHLWFKEVFDNGGFDIVIGNPPYHQLAKLKDEALAKAGFETFDKSGDIYCLFYEMGIKILRKHGVLSYITSNSWLQTQYGYELRKYFVDKTNPIVLLNFTDLQLFETAVVETSIILLKKESFRGLLRVAVLDERFKNGESMAEFLNSFGHEVKELLNEGWVIGDQKDNDLKRKIEQIGKRLKDWDIRIDYGIKTGLNEAFIISSDIRKELIKADRKNANIIKPTLRGRDLKRYSYAFGDLWIIVSAFKKHEDLIANYPAVHQYLLKYEKQLKARGQVTNGQHHWLELDNNPTEIYLDLFEEPKIIWGELSNQAKFTFDDSMHYVNNTMFMLLGDSLKFLLGVLNSKLAQWYFEKISTTSGMGTNRWLKYKVQQLPVPPPSTKIEDHIERLVNQILDVKQRNGDSSKWENKLDAIVFQLYDMTESEMTQVLESIKDLSIKDRNQIQNEYWYLANNKFQLEA